MSVDIPASSEQITAMLRLWGHGDTEALQAVLPHIYDELRRIAHNQLRKQRSQHTLQTTALINEAYLRLADERKLQVKDRDHFLGIAAHLMRWILVDYERRRRAVKRGAGATCVSLDQNLVAKDDPAQSDVDVLALDQALLRLAELDSQQSQIVELRYFGGLSIEETGKLLGVSPATVKRSWSSARAWLLRELDASTQT